MSRESTLNFSLLNLFKRGSWSKPELAARICKLECSALVQGLHFLSEPVYEFASLDGFQNGCDYSGIPLFQVPAYPLVSYQFMEDGSVIKLSREKELWILEDYSFALVSKAEINFANEDGDFVAAYRALRSTDLDEIAEEAGFLFDEIYQNLLLIQQDYHSVPFPNYEL